MPELNTVLGSDLHFPRGTDLAAVDKVFVSDGAAGGSFKTAFSMGWEDYDDAATAGSPIALVLADTQYILTNDGLGPVTDDSFRLPGNSAAWNTSTNRLDFTSLDIGDFVEIRFDYIPTTTGVNHELILAVNFSIGGVTPFTLTIQEQLIKTASTQEVTRYVGFFIGSSDIRDNPASITLQSDSTGDSVVVNGWLIKTTPVSPVYV